MLNIEFYQIIVSNNRNRKQKKCYFTTEKVLILLKFAWPITSVIIK